MGLAINSLPSLLATAILSICKLVFYRLVAKKLVIANFRKLLMYFMCYVFSKYDIQLLSHEVHVLSI